jgi:hypothetical protein
MEPFEHLDHYTLLGVERNASTDEIKRAYRQQMTRYHPDRYANGTAEEQDYASRRSQQINEAYRVLSDFAARASYTRQLSSGQAGSAPPRPAPTPPAVARDHQAELYQQAQDHLAAGRMLQAAATLRELQRLNPLYRDSAALLARAEAALNTATASPPEPADPSQRRRLFIALGGLAAAGLAAIGIRWLIPSGPSASQATGGTGVSLVPTSSAAGAARVETPLVSPTLPPASATAVPTVPVVPTENPVPTANSVPTLEPQPLPTAALPPTATPPPPIVTDFIEDGPVLLADNTAAGRAFATAQGAGWSVGYIDGAYQIVANQGVGRIWSFARYPGLGDHTMGVDMIADGGEAGVLLRFGGSDTYLSFILVPNEGRWSLDQRLPGGTQTLAGDLSPAINTTLGGINRLAAAARGNRLVLAINNVRVFDQAFDTPPPSELYGLIAIGGATNVVALFSSLVLRGV